MVKHWLIFFAREAMLLLYFLRCSLPRNMLEHNKQVQKTYVMDIYSVKQPPNIIIEVKMKEHKIGKKEYWKKVDEIYFIAFIL